MPAIQGIIFAIMARSFASKVGCFCKVEPTYIGRDTATAAGIKHGQCDMVFVGENKVFCFIIFFIDENFSRIGSTRSKLN